MKVYAETTPEREDNSQVLPSAIHNDSSRLTKQIKDEYLGKVKSDEVAFSVGVFAVIVSAWLAGAYPYCFWILHAVGLTFLLRYKLYINAQENKQWYLIDYCYIVNYLLIIYYILCALGTVVPDVQDLMQSIGPILFRCLFAACAGPLALATVALRNSLVFHDWNMLCIFMVHFSPNLALWGMRWWPEELSHAFPDAFNIACSNLPPQRTLFFSPDDCSGTFVELFVYPVVLYLMWLVPYVAFVFWMGAGYLERKGYHTVYEETKDTPLFLILLKGEEKWKPLKYMCIHFVSASATFLVAPLLWHSFALHTAYMMILLCIALRNGGTYYFRVFARRYYDSKMGASSTTAETEAEKQDSGAMAMSHGQTP